MPGPVRFECLHAHPGLQGRRGRLHTPHGIVETPAFMPVGTQATVKTLASEDVEEIGFQMLLCNAYHLTVRPGSQAISELGGLHKFMGWNGAILTDSGGFQVMSLAGLRTISEEGVTFRNHVDGSALHLTPESVIQAQAALGVDVSMVLDVCPGFPCEREENERSVRLTQLWAERSKQAEAENQSTFGIVQGGVHEDLRKLSAKALVDLDFEGYAIGGVSVGEPNLMQSTVVRETAPLLPKEKPRYLMGVGHPQDILHAVEHGIDLFDCVLPTRLARHRSLYTLHGRVNLSAAKWARHDGPVDELSVFPGLERYTAAYLRHLFQAQEPLGPRLATLHNLGFYHRLMAEIRQALQEGTWDALRERYRDA